MSNVRLLMTLVQVLGTLFKWAAGTTMVLAWPVLPITGYYLKACTEGAIGWALVTMLSVAVQAPAVAFLFACAAALYEPLAKPFRSAEVWVAICKLWAVSSICIAFLVWLLAHIFNWSARCSLLR
jgi:hypothetical protein